MSTSRRVQAQYESLPYPPRDPADEQRRLLRTVGDDLDCISHYGFRGQARFGPDFRALIAGGGTGDSAIFLADQLRPYGAEVVYVDLSTASMQVAQERAKVRQLRNIQWHQHSLLELDALELGAFDYINCSGVIHHLADPAAGLKSLAAALKPRGLLYLMVYGQAAREPIYQIQQLLRTLAPDTLPDEVRLDRCRRLLDQLPDSNLFRRTLDVWEVDVFSNGDAGLYDLLLHSQDRAYSVPEVYSLLQSEQLALVEFVGEGWMGPIGYDPLALVSDEELRQALAELTVEQRQAFAELYCSRQLKHQLYASKGEKRVASINDPGSIPILSGALRGQASRICLQIAEQAPMTLNLEFPGLKLSTQIPGSRLMQETFRVLDGHHDLQQIHQHVQRSLPEIDYQAFLNQFRSVYEDLNRVGWIMLSDRLTLRPSRSRKARTEVGG